jgi:tetratricopeptide (TPR) repeat protein
LNPSYVIAALLLLGAIGAAVVLLRRGRDLPGFACLVAAPVLAALPVALWPAGGPDAPAPMATAPSAAPATAGGAAPGAATPADAARERGIRARAERRFADAQAAFTEVTRLAPGDADAWADLADVSAAVAGGDLGAGEAALDRALAIDPAHVKALWLRASLAVQRKDYAAAAPIWEKLASLVPPGSDEARVLAANLQEARALAAAPR